MSKQTKKTAAAKPAAPIYEGTLGMVKHQQTHPAGTQFELGGTTGKTQVDGMHKECPRCGLTATGAAAIYYYFGFRTMARKSGNRYSVPQPYCRRCRSSHAKEMRLRKKLAADLPAEEEKVEALVELCANVIRLGEKLQELAREQRADSKQWEKWWAKVNATRLERLRQEENEDA